MTFHPFITVPSRLLHLYSTEDKTPRLMVKQFSTARNTQRNSQSYIDKREEGDRGDRMRKGRVKRGERSLASPLPRSKLLTFLGALQGHRPRWAVCFVPLPGPSTSGSWVGLGGLCVLFTSVVPANEFPVQPPLSVGGCERLCHVSVSTCNCG